MGDILSNQHLLPLTTEAYILADDLSGGHILRHAVWVRQERGVSLGTRGRSSQREPEEQWLTRRAAGLCD